MNQPESFEQVSGILSMIQRIHQQIRQFFIVNGVEFSDQQETLLIAQLAEDQRELESAMVNLRFRLLGRTGASPWIQYVPRQELDSIVQQMLDLRSPSLEQVVSETSKLYHAVATFVQRIQEQTPSQETAAILENVRFFEQQKARALSERVVGLADI